MRALVQIVEALGAAPSLDSSDALVSAAGLEASSHPNRLVLNSASAERLELSIFDVVLSQMAK
jgi:hypothetical protein